MLMSVTVKLCWALRPPAPARRVALSPPQASEREAAERAQQAAVKDVEEWCQGEVDAVRHVSRQQLAQAHALAQQW